jgi:hypothetical protein
LILTSGVYAVVFDGAIDKLILQAAERINLTHLIGMSSKVGTIRSRVNVLTIDAL